MPLPDHDFDVTEVAVPWRLLRDAGHTLIFATEVAGTRPAADPRLLDGVLFGKLGAEAEAIAFYRALEDAREFRETIGWSSIDAARFDALLLPGGHAPRMRQYLGSTLLQDKVAAFWRTGKPVAAICHGTLLLARAKDQTTGKSVLSASRTTCLPKYMERLAYALTSWKLGRYYRTYDAYVEDEVRAALDDPERQFVRGPTTLGTRGTMIDDAPAFVVDDGRYVSARWPGDAYAFARLLATKLERLPPA